jgi:hypothetical protein
MTESEMRVVEAALRWREARLALELFQTEALAADEEAAARSREVAHATELDLIAAVDAVRAERARQEGE